MVELTCCRHVMSLCLEAEAKKKAEEEAKAKADAGTSSLVL